MVKVALDAFGLKVMSTITHKTAVKAKQDSTINSALHSLEEGGIPKGLLLIKIIRAGALIEET